MGVLYIGVTPLSRKASQTTTHRPGGGASSRNTRENAELSAELLRERGIQQILLVTSALHMRRAVHLFEQQGLVVHPVATDHEVGSPKGRLTWLPDAHALDGRARAFKQWVDFPQDRGVVSGQPGVGEQRDHRCQFDHCCQSGLTKKETFNPA